MTEKELKKEIEEKDILQNLYDKGMIDFEGDEDNLIMQVPTNIVGTGKFVIDVYKVGYEKAQEDFNKKIDKLKKEILSVVRTIAFYNKECEEGAISEIEKIFSKEEKIK